MLSRSKMSFITCAITLVVIFLSNVAFAGECLGPSEEERYKSLLESYEKFKAGEAANGPLQIFENWCWSPDSELDTSLRHLLEEIVQDENLGQGDHYNALSNYLDFYGPNAFTAPYIEKSTGQTREKLIEKLLYKKFPDSLDSTTFFKREISKETNPKLKGKMVERLAGNYVNRFNDFYQYCSANNLEISPHAIVRFMDMDALSYLVEKTDYLSGKFGPPYDYASSYSDFIYKVLAKNLDVVFPLEYLKHVSEKELRLLRNGIYATYGRNFKSKNLTYYYYGSYPYVKMFCRGDVCGLTKARGTFKDDDLSETDKENLARILRVEGEKKAEDAESLFVESYDFESFINDSKDNFVFSSPKIQQLKHLKIDWDRNQVFIWDKFGVSGWNYLTGKRFKFIKKAKGPIGLAPGKRLIAYQLNGEVVVEHLDDGKVLFVAPIGRSRPDEWINTVNYFTEDGTFFVTQVERGQLKLFNTTTQQVDQVDFARFSPRRGELSCTGYGSASINLINSPIVETANNQLIGLLYGGLFIVPLDDPQKIKFLEFDDNDKSEGYCSIALSPNQEYLYADPGFKKFIARFYLDEVVNTQDGPRFYRDNIDAGDRDFGYIATLKATDDFLFRGNTSVLGWVNLGYGQNSGTETFEGLGGSSVDISVEKNILALGDSRGYVVFKKLPQPESD